MPRKISTNVKLEKISSPFAVNKLCSHRPRTANVFSKSDNYCKNSSINRVIYIVYWKHQSFEEQCNAKNWSWNLSIFAMLMDVWPNLQISLYDWPVIRSDRENIHECRKATVKHPENISFRQYILGSCIKSCIHVISCHTVKCWLVGICNE